MSKYQSEKRSVRAKPYYGNSRSTVWIVLSVSVVLAVVAFAGSTV